MYRPFLPSSLPLFLFPFRGRVNGAFKARGWMWGVVYSVVRLVRLETTALHSYIDIANCVSLSLQSERRERDAHFHKGHFISIVT